MVLIVFKVKEKCYDALAGVSSLMTTWISQNSATQRKGRAGRTRSGVVFRLYSFARYDNMPEHATPEILRTPLMELCLQTKLLAPHGTTITEFLGKTPSPPSGMVIKAALNNLKTIQALDPDENVTLLGKHLLELPVDPQLGKMILTALVLQCLDPVLTIVCCMSYR
jgi:HrpA-like RNA helicase